MADFDANGKIFFLSNKKIANYTYEDVRIVAGDSSQL